MHCADPRSKHVRRELTEIGAGGELLPDDGNDLGTPTEANAAPAAVLRNTVADPDCVAVDASLHRLELARRTGALELGVDLADTVQAGNSLEKMLCYQLAATHRATAHMTVRLNRNIETLEHICTDRSNIGYFQTLNTEACRLAGAIARLQSTFQDGALTLQKLRTGGQQTVVVQHVNVRKGGQAVVAGQVGGGSGRSKPKG